MNLINDDELYQMVLNDEGFSATMYQDTEGLNTIGIGFCLDRIEMPEVVAKAWFRCIISDIYHQLEATEDIYAIFNRLDRTRQLAILNMCYQMGVRGVHSFKRMWAALAQGDYELAARESALSKWARQTPLRAARIATVIKTGSLDNYTA